MDINCHGTYEINLTTPVAQSSCNLNTQRVSVISIFGTVEHLHSAWLYIQTSEDTPKASTLNMEIRNLVDKVLRPSMNIEQEHLCKPEVQLPNIYVNTISSNQSPSSSTSVRCSVEPCQFSIKDQELQKRQGNCSSFPIGCNPLMPCPWSRPTCPGKASYRHGPFGIF